MNQGETPIPPSVSRREVLKGLAAMTGAVFMPKIEIDGAQEINQDLESVAGIKIKEMCPVQPLVFWTEKRSIVEDKNYLPFNEVIMPFPEVKPDGPHVPGQENARDSEPRVSRARADKLPPLSEKSDLKGVFGISPEYMVFMNQPFAEVTVAENINPVQEPGQPHKITAGIPLNKDQYTLLGVTYDLDKLPAGYEGPDWVKALEEKKDPNQQVTEIFSLTDIAKYLVRNAAEDLQLETDDVLVDEVMMISTDCVVCRININGQLGFFAFDVKARKPVDVAQLGDLNPHVLARPVNTGLGIKIVDMTEAGDFIKAPGLIFSKPNKDTIVDVKSGLIASEPKSLNYSWINKRIYYTFGFVPEHINKEEYRFVQQRKETPQRSSLRILPLAHGGDRTEILDQAYAPYHRPVIVRTVGDKVYEEADPISSQPPKLIMPITAVAELSQDHLDQTLTGQTEGSNLVAQVRELDLFNRRDDIGDELAFGRNLGQPSVKLGDVRSGVLPNMTTFENGRFTFAVSEGDEEATVTTNQVKPRKKHIKIETPYNENDNERVLKCSLSGVIEI